ncbi:MAG TPA: AAA domain-containing protein, partial [Polyangium sp.]|nr:AAA domain-containing protein [Polyangium sp.]
MAELYFQNLGIAQPAAVQRAVYRYLQSFYQFLERAKTHLENTRPELGWKLLGFPALLEPPRGTRNVRAWQNALSRLLEHNDLTITGAGAVITVLATHSERSIVVFDASPQRNVVFELRATGQENALPVQITLFGENIEALQKSLGSDGVWIELEDPDDDDGEKILEAFFDEDTKSVYEVDPKIDARKDRYPRERSIRIQDSDRECLALKLDRLPKTREICVQPNTYPIRCQMSAIRALEDQPLAEHRPLIRLLEDLNPFAWPIPKPLGERFIWRELRNENRPGTLQQREFVERAMTTRDFMVLEGPPGSGKTTAIVELILQYAARGRRVLLCASTHVAVDNVIERLKDPERKGDQVLLVRIGKEKRVSDLVKPYRLETM